MRISELLGVISPARRARAGAVNRDTAPEIGPRKLSPDANQAAPVAIVGDVAVDLKDVDGLASPGQDDLRGTAKGQVALDREYLLQRLRDAIKSDGKKAITRIAFDPAGRRYVVEGHAKLFGRFRGPGFRVEMTADREGHLVVAGRSWADPILRLLGQPTVTDWVERSVSAYQAPIKTRRQGRKLILEGIKNLTVPLGSENIKLTLSDYTPRAGNPGPFSIAADGRVVTGLEGEVRGFIWHGKPTGASEQPDRANLQVHFVGRADRSVSTRVTGTATVGITEEQLTGLTGQRGEVLFPLLRSGRATFSDLLIEGTYSDRRQWDSKLSGNLRVETPQGLRIDTPVSGTIDDAGKGVLASAGPISWRDPFNGEQRIEKIGYTQGPEGLRLDVVEPPDKPIEVPYAGNRLGLLVGGGPYYAKLLEAVGQAREGVALESFGYGRGERTEKLMEKLLDKAAEGVRIRLLIDPGPFGDDNWAARVQATLAGKEDDAWTRKYMAGKSDAQLAAIRERFRVQDHPGGLARTNHRKVVVVDGVLGFTGGVNVSNLHFQAVQDAMVPVIGPAVRDLADAFLRTWTEDGGQVTEADRTAFLKDEATISREGGARFGSFVGGSQAQARVLVTDDRQAEIEAAYLEAIGAARDSVKVEQQYLTERRIVDALVAAVRRGVDVTVVVPEDQDNEFELGNNLAILRLLQAAAEPDAGKVDARYYQTRGTWAYHVHSKVLVADGKRALVGSANVDQRAMRGLATTDKGRLLWNKELDLDIADSAFAAQLDREMFGADSRKSESRDVWEKIVSSRLEAPVKREGQDFGKLGTELRALMAQEAARALQEAGSSPAEEAAKARLRQALARAEAAWPETWRQAVDPRTDRVAFLKSKLPAGRGLDAELYVLERDGAKRWPAAAAHAALYEIEGAIADLYRAGGESRHAAWLKQALRPDEGKARLSDAFNVLF